MSDGVDATAEDLDIVPYPSGPFRSELIFIPAGEFLMGRDPAQDESSYNAELPQHSLCLPGYYIGKTPVTNAQYDAFVEATGYAAPPQWAGARRPVGREEHPVVGVCWHDALAYCLWLAEVLGKAYMLPSEAEWEKAASWDPGQQRKRIYPWGDVWDASRCNTEEGGPGDTTPVGQYPRGASAYGALDMAGNVWEWTRSLWWPDRQRVPGTQFRYPYRPDDGRENLDAPGDVWRVIRGGSFRDARLHARCTSRWWNFLYPHEHSGFWVVVSPIS